MCVYVDNFRSRYGRMTMVHMIADTTDELLRMADTIGVNKKWIQKSGTAYEHFDVCLAKRKLALANGAKEITLREEAKLYEQKNRSIDDAKSVLESGS